MKDFSLLPLVILLGFLYLAYEAIFLKPHFSKQQRKYISKMWKKYEKAGYRVYHTDYKTSFANFFIYEDKGSDSGRDYNRSQEAIYINCIKKIALKGKGLKFDHEKVRNIIEPPIPFE
ncbi:MAG: hypothetical protein KDD27_27875 [Saprospiraceae bacterium]|nr:hypothetical protein [Saprospiraceae bacterium]